MKNICLIISFMLIIFVVSEFACAAEIGSWEGYGGAGFSTYSLEEVNNYLQGEKVDAGVFFFIGYRKWISPEFALGSEIESMEVAWQDSSYETGTTGYLATFNYELMPDIYIFGAVGLYYLELHGFNFAGEGPNFGYKLGVEKNLKITESLDLQGKVMYRNNKIKTEGLEFDFSGLGINLALTYKF
ncbi:hypothetical protein [Halothermothrix orenii]|uniref:Outer membrane protein beta-barrel domain-containing protein n=1 Tax=Halothermothrix orenii (strain H 168 / OCM 544 / DSM 9562) TaxID=373903 RepID=B8CZU8_HALOH|nr:hypothetical protein [Halothermothrix orenii]ACL70800.1 hypothetical protein Hore_20550 [Halothermothrix orenii H 168]